MRPTDIIGMHGSKTRRTAWCAALMILASVVACASSTQQAEQQRLVEAVEKLRQKLVRQEARLEELSNQVFVLSDRVDTARVELSRPAVPTELEVVRLVPDTARPAPPARSPKRNVEPPVVIQRGDGGELEVRPARRSAPAPRKPGAEKRFREALTAYREGKVELAFKRFASFYAAFERHAYADNALYWMGECRYDGKEYREAIKMFARVLTRYPRSNKVPDALLKMGLAYERLGEPQMAHKAFSDLVAGYPRSAIADLARSHLRAGAPSGGSR